MQKERTFNVEYLKNICDEIHPLVQNSLARSRAQSKKSVSPCKLSNFHEEDFVLASRDKYGAEEKLLLCWRGGRCVIKALNDCTYQLEDLRTGHLNEIHTTRLEFYLYEAVDERLIMDCVLQSQTGMRAARLMGPEDCFEGLQVFCLLERIWQVRSLFEVSDKRLRTSARDVQRHLPARELAQEPSCQSQSRSVFLKEGSVALAPGTAYPPVVMA